MGCRGSEVRIFSPRPTSKSYGCSCGRLPDQTRCLLSAAAATPTHLYGENPNGTSSSSPTCPIDEARECCLFCKCSAARDEQPQLILAGSNDADVRLGHRVPRAREVAEWLGDNDPCLIREACKFLALRVERF